MRRGARHRKRRVGAACDKKRAGPSAGRAHRRGRWRRIHLDKGYRGHDYPNKFRVWISGQVRRVTKTIRRGMRRRAAVEPVIGHVKAEHPMDRNYLKGRDGDRANAVLAAAGYDFSLLVRWFEALLRALIAVLLRTPVTTQIA